jgi:peroxiredoxin
MPSGPSIGDSVPSIQVQLEDGTSISFADLVANKRVVCLTVPGNFTPGCSKTHLPGFLAQADAIKSKGVNEIFCISTDNFFLQQAWSVANNSAGKITHLADVSGDLCRALKLDLDLAVLRIGASYARSSFVINHGKFTHVNVEPEDKPTGLTCSLADPLLKQLLAE